MKLELTLRCADSDLMVPSMKFQGTCVPPSLLHLEEAPGQVCLCRDLGASLHSGSRSAKKKKASEKSQVSLLSLFYVTNTGF